MGGRILIEICIQWKTKCLFTDFEQRAHLFAETCVHNYLPPDSYTKTKKQNEITIGWII